MHPPLHPSSQASLISSIPFHFPLLPSRQPSQKARNSFALQFQISPFNLVFHSSLSLPDSVSGGAFSVICEDSFALPSSSLTDTVLCGLCLGPSWYSISAFYIVLSSPFYVDCTLDRFSLFFYILNIYSLKILHLAYFMFHAPNYLSPTDIEIYQLTPHPTSCLLLLLLLISLGPLELIIYK